MISLALKVGDLVEIDGDGLTARFRTSKELSGGRMLFLRDDTDGEVILPERRIEEMLASGLFRRIEQHTTKAGRPSSYDIDEGVPPDGATLDARTRCFYVREWDKRPTGLGTNALDDFVEKLYPLAVKRGFAWRISAGTLRRAINERGEPGSRPVHVMEKRTGKVPRAPRHGALAGELMRRTVAWFYARRERTKTDAYARLSVLTRRVNRLGRRRFLSWIDAPLPSEEATRLRICGAECRDTLAAKFDKDEARRLTGTAPGLDAARILETVVIDSTIADQWIFDAVRNLPLGRPTLTVAIDVHSRMPLAVVVTWEPPSLYTAGRAIYETCRPKHDWRERFPNLTRDYDGWGKPRTVLVDNAWEQVGVSFQDAYEDVGISIEWAPVATPEYKALGERFFGFLNTLVHHRSRGGVPFPPHLMRKFKLDPAKDTVVELTDYEELVHQAIVEVYQTKVHTTLGKPPALAWKESKASHTRPFIDDLRQLRTLVGAVARATVRRDGVRLRGHRFHDEHAVTRLLDALARTTPIRRRPKGGATAGVKVKYDPADCSFVDVWNPVAKNYERLSNVDKRFTRGDLSFKNADDVRAWAKVENLAFESDEDRWKARNGLRSTIERVTAGDVRFTYIRNARRLLHPAKAISGDVVETVTAMATAAGLGPFDVQHRVAMHARDDDGMPEKGPPRGKPKGPKRPRKQAATSAGSVPSKPAGAAAPPPSAKPAGSGFDASEIDAAMSLDWVIASTKDQDR